jgi:MraZ protein
LSTYLGQYLHSIDDKGRVPLPAKFRNGDEATEFVLVRGSGSCLYLFTRDAWTVREGRLRHLRHGGNPDGRRNALAITAHAAEVALDRHGRLSLPQPLMQVAGLERDALFVGAGELVEIWNPDRFATFVRLDELDYDGVADSVL